MKHSLTHCCNWPAEGRSVLHIERSWLAIWATTDRPMSSSTCCSHVLRGRPGERFQSAAGECQCISFYWMTAACEAVVFSDRQQMWPNNEWRLSAIRDGIGPVVSFSHWPRIRRSAMQHSEHTGKTKTKQKWKIQTWLGLRCILFKTNDNTGYSVQKLQYNDRIK